MTVLGCIADDFTGASDAASFLVKGGMSVCLYNGVPARGAMAAGETQAIVIALKSRTQERKDAVADSLTAAEFLLSQGAKQLYFKYCSTFDSTPEGNIGPVADALMERAGAPYTLLCPSLPANGRTVEGGSLFVNGVPLHQSHMKDHPLTPMRDCRVDRLMAPQSRYPSRVLPREALNGFRPPEDGPCYLIPDYSTDEDGRRIAHTWGRLPLLTGGSGLLEHLAREWTGGTAEKGRIPKAGTRGRALLLAGSCSKATLGQIAWYQAQGKPSFKLDPGALLTGAQTFEDAWDFVAAHQGAEDTVLVYSSDTPERVREYQRLGAGKVAALLEGITARLAQRAVEAGYTRIISAGGETSGAVTKGLGFQSYLIGPSVAPGVPVMVPAEAPGIRLVLKSGNFGGEDFFGQALEITGENGI